MEKTRETFRVCLDQQIGQGKKAQGIESFLGNVFP